VVIWKSEGELVPEEIVRSGKKSFSWNGMWGPKGFDALGGGGGARLESVI
jgi:hypothetical protein